MRRSDAEPGVRRYDAKRWAQRRLGVRRWRPQEHTRADLLKRLADAELIPQEADDAAVRVLLGEPGAAERAKPHMLLDLERRLGRAIDRFAGHVSKMPPHVRRMRWQKLRAHAEAFPRLRRRLHALWTRVKLSSQEERSHGRELDELARMLKRLGAMRRSEAAAARRTFVAEREGERSRIRKQAIAIRDRYPHLAALDPDLISMLVDQDKPLSAARSRGGAAVGARPGPPPAPGETGRNWKAIGIVVVCVLALKMCVMLARQESDPSSRYRGGHDAEQVDPEAVRQLIESLRDHPPLDREESWRRIDAPEFPNQKDLERYDRLLRDADASDEGGEGGEAMPTPPPSPEPWLRVEGLDDEAAGSGSGDP